MGHGERRRVGALTARRDDDNDDDEPTLPAGPAPAGMGGTGHG